MATLRARLYTHDIVERILVQLRKEEELTIDEDLDDAGVFDVKFEGNTIFAGVQNPAGNWICRVHPSFLPGED